MEDEKLRERVLSAAVTYLMSTSHEFEALMLLRADFDYECRHVDTALALSGDIICLLDCMATLRVPPERLDWYQKAMTAERREVLEAALHEVIRSVDDAGTCTQHVYLDVQMALPNPYAGWKEVTLSQIRGDTEPLNQGIVGSPGSAAVWNGLRFRSVTEAKIAEALARRDNLLFCPLPAAVSGLQKKEPDFLVCYNGKWGILEVQGEPFHPSVKEENERARWFKTRGVKVVEGYDAARCHQEPDKVVAEFLSLLARS